MNLKLTNFLSLFTLLFSINLLADEVTTPVKVESKKEEVLDFSAGVIEGELNRPSILMELGSNFKDFNDLLLLREDFNNYHKIDSGTRLRFIEETNE